MCGQNVVVKPFGQIVFVTQRMKTRDFTWSRFVVGPSAKAPASSDPRTKGTNAHVQHTILLFEPPPFSFCSRPTHPIENLEDLLDVWSFDSWWFFPTFFRSNLFGNPGGSWKLQGWHRARYEETSGKRERLTQCPNWKTHLSPERTGTVAYRNRLGTV